jgi:large subunit ribosomal protein L1
MKSKRFRAAASKIEAGKAYPINEAVALAKDTATTKFDASVDVHIRLGLDSKQGTQVVRATAQLPHGTGKTLRIAVFAKGPAAEAAKKAGATVVGDDALVKEIKTSGRTDFDVAIATPEMMKSLAPIAKTLGTKGLMPNPKNETVSADPAKMVKALATGKIAFRADDSGNVHQTIGKVSFAPEQLQANYEALIEAVKKAKPADTKGVYLRGVTLTTSMGPGIIVAI